MTNEMVTTVKCPYCGNEAKYLVTSPGFTVLLCDIEDTPGCDEYFVIKSTLKVEYQAFEMKATDEKDWLTENLPQTQGSCTERPGAEYGAEA